MYSNTLNNWFYGEDVQVDDMKLLTKTFMQLCFAANGGNPMATGITPTITGNNIATTKGFVYFGETSDAIFIERTGTNQLLSFVDPTSVPLIANGYLYVKPRITYDVNNRTSTVSGVVYTSTSATAEGINLATITNSVITQINSINPFGATQLQRGIVQLATQAEVTAGTDASKAVVPSTLATLLSASWQPKLGYTPVQQGGGTGQLTNKLYIGWGTNSRIKVQVDSTDQGNLVTDTYLNNGTLPASFKTALSLVGSGSMYVTGTGDISGFGFVAATPAGIYAPNGNSHLGALTMQKQSVANLGISYPNIPGCANSYAMKFGWDGSHVRGVVDNNPNATFILANLGDVQNAVVASKNAAGIYPTNIGNCNIAGVTDYNGRTTTLTITTPVLNNGFNLTLSVSPANMALFLGLAIPTHAAMLIQPGAISTRQSMGTLSAADINWLTISLDSNTWNIALNSNQYDGARNIAFTFTAMFSF